MLATLAPAARPEEVDEVGLPVLELPVGVEPPTTVVSTTVDSGIRDVMEPETKVEKLVLVDTIVLFDGREEMAGDEELLLFEDVVFLYHY